MAVEAEGDPYRTTLDRISQFSKKNKQTTRMNAHKTEWLQEWHRLRPSNASSTKTWRNR